MGTRLLCWIELELELPVVKPFLWTAVQDSKYRRRKKNTEE